MSALVQFGRKKGEKGKFFSSVELVSSYFFLVTRPLNPLSKFSSHSASSKVTVTPLGTVPGQRIVRHLGTLLLYLIKETMAVRQAGGVGVFVKVFIAEVSCEDRYS